jgi:ribosomal protein S18 acetylase RimI-like enzyme
MGVKADGGQTYWKVPFERSGDPLAELPRRDVALSWIPAEGDERFLGTVEDVLGLSPDASDIARITKLGPAAAARDLIDAVPEWGMSRQPGWWELLALGGEVVGFVMPVTYDGCGRDGLDEATIFHMGVRPAHRGAGLGRLLLRRATQTLVEHGVWRIYCDTAANNHSMIHLFEAEQWTRLPPQERPV